MIVKFWQQILNTFWLPKAFAKITTIEAIAVPIVTVAIDYTAHFTMPLLPYVLGIIALLICDLFTGITAAKHRGEKIRSNGFRRTLVKINMYFIALLLGRIMELVFIPFVPVVEIIAGYVAVVEFKSNAENIADVTGTNIWQHFKEFVLNRKKSE